MTVEEIRGGDNETDKFPIGMRVLAVDDNPTCLKLLEGLLRKCQYKVTTTNQAITALNMLRENRNRFDLIISDVYMPDMDGFKLLELVGLEMDLPVIMLSGNGDRNLVMKGITHGACDYLVKPVRLEELRNIWQHVIRRKVGSKSKNKREKSDQWNEGGDQNEKLLNRKRKEEDEDEDVENGNESDDPTTKKRPRVVWSIDLHRKFVAAINQLGIEKAVPKRILDLMNVDGLTRENVASHLQKYRLYLKRISHQSNMVVAFGGNNDASSYTRMSPLDGLGDFRTLSCSGRLPNATYAPAGMLGRLNSATGVALHSLTSSPLVQPNHAPNKLQTVASSNHQNMNLFQGIPPSFDLDHLESSNKPYAQLTDYNSIEESRIFTGTNLATLNSIDEPRICKGSGTFTDPINVLASQGGVKLPSTGTEAFNLDSNRNQPLNFSSNLLPVGENYTYPATIGFSSNIPTTATVPIEAHSDGLVGDIVQNVNQSLSNQKGAGGPCSKQDYSQYSQNAFTTLAASALGGYGGLSGPVSHRRPNGGGSTLVQTEQTKLQSGFVSSNGYGSLDDIVPGFFKREQNMPMLTNGEFEYDPYMVPGRMYDNDSR
ncbi:hypothetical protein QVD17_22932 [Tagetes erecta]|uniref:Two-component response regulator n=1 Tax=Tagetes erecta TaxID=13708 RepID=A0AAD8NTT3_TARER|nr:hypothetical protein QVD17_22932 [Tagetes erecta]